jgi:hypothetical protein
MRRMLSPIDDGRIQVFEHPTERQLSQAMLDLGANYVAVTKIPDSDQAALIDDGNGAFDRVREQCK